MYLKRSNVSTVQYDVIVLFFRIKKKKKKHLVELHGVPTFGETPTEMLNPSQSGLFA